MNNYSLQGHISTVIACLIMHFTKQIELNKFLNVQTLNCLSFHQVQSIITVSGNTTNENRLLD